MRSCKLRLQPLTWMRYAASFSSFFAATLTGFAECPMTSRRTGNLLAMLFLFVGTLLRGAWLEDGFRYLAFVYILTDILLRARAGYLRRRPYWTPDSWRGYLKACSFPVGALVLMVLMLAALDWRLPIVGAS